MSDQPNTKPESEGKTKDRNGLKQFLLVLVMLSVALLILGTLYYLVKWSDGQTNEIRLPLLAIAGVVVLLVSLALVSVSFAVFKLSDPGQALALPEGSIRAVIALSLVVIFAILSVYLYTNMSAERPTVLANLTEGQKNQLQQGTLASEIILITTNSIANSTPSFSVLFRPTNSASDDFAKQLLVLIGTLMTSVTSFYFATRASASASTTESGTGTSPSKPSASP